MYSWKNKSSPNRQFDSAGILRLFLGRSGSAVQPDLDRDLKRPKKRPAGSRCVGIAGACVRSPKYPWPSLDNVCSYLETCMAKIYSR